MTLVDQFIAYDDGKMSDAEIVQFMQRLIDEQLFDRIEGRYGRHAKRLVDAGVIFKKGDPSDPRNSRIIASP